MRKRLVFVSLILAAGMSGIAGDSAAGAVGGSSGPLRLEPQRSHAAPGPNADIRVDVNMALVPVTVTDGVGRNVTGLSRENFRVYDGSKEVPITSFGFEDQPIAVGLIFDCSESMTDKFKTARLAPDELYKQLDNHDESFLVTVSGRPVLRQKLTSNFSDILNALLFTHPGGITSLLDGVVLGLAQLKHANHPRKALVVVSDGGENNSRYTLRELEAMAAESDAQIFALGLHQNPRTQEEVEGPHLLRELTRNTGGVNYQVDDLNDLRSAMGQIGVSLHSQYVLGYYPPANAAGGKHRRVKVQLMLPPGLPKLMVFARSQYFVPER
jgi:Ca-activated chloride channel homolog